MAWHLPGIPLARRPARRGSSRAGRLDGRARAVNSRSSWPLCEKARLREGHLRVVGARAKRHHRGQETEPSGASLCAAHGGLREPGNHAPLARAAHYSLCDLLCARDAACLSETASQWYQEGDPRHAAFSACLADRVVRARGVAALPQYHHCYSTYLVPDKTISSMIKYLEAVERLGSTKIVEQTTYMRVRRRVLTSHCRKPRGH